MRAPGTGAAATAPHGQCRQVQCPTSSITGLQILLLVGNVSIKCISNRKCCFVLYRNTSALAELVTGVSEVQDKTVWSSKEKILHLLEVKSTLPSLLGFAFPTVPKGEGIRVNVDPCVGVELPSQPTTRSGTLMRLHLLETDQAKWEHLAKSSSAGTRSSALVWGEPREGRVHILPAVGHKGRRGCFCSPPGKSWPEDFAGSKPGVAERGLCLGRTHLHAGQSCTTLLAQRHQK